MHIINDCWYLPFPFQFRFVCQHWLLFAFHDRISKIEMYIMLSLFVSESYFLILFYLDIAKYRSLYPKFINCISFWGINNILRIRVNERQQKRKHKFLTKVPRRLTLNRIGKNRKIKMIFVFYSAFVQLLFFRYMLKLF